MCAYLDAAGQPEGVNTKLIELAGKTVGPCQACGACTKDLKCATDDDFTEFIKIFQDPTFAGLIVGTPVYFGTMTAQCKAFLDRTAVFRRNGWMLRDKVGGALAVGRFRNGGQELTLQAVRAAMLCQDMICVSDGQPTAHFGAALCPGGEGGLAADTKGVAGPYDWPASNILLEGLPPAWILPGKSVKVRDVLNEFGPISLLSTDPPDRTRPREIPLARQTR
jgi:multimeric flavodoxin WrbA